MAVYVITAEGGWPVDGLSRDPQVGEMFEVTRNGEAARSVIAVAPHLDLLALRRHLGARGLDPSDAPRRARAVFRYLGGIEARRWAEMGSLHYRDGDNALLVPIDLGLPSAGRLVLTGEFPIYEPGDQIGPPFDVDD